MIELEYTTKVLEVIFKFVWTHPGWAVTILICWIILLTK